ncbi:RecQ family ATP-dependent DNA helicase [Breznakiellaceae bacterium SP9]
MDFDDFGAPTPTSDLLSAAVKELFGLSYLYPYQRLVVTNILDAARASGLQLQWPGQTASTENDASADREADTATNGRQIVILPTGAGKSLCFQLPSILLPRPTLVIYPLLSLMADQERSLKEKGLATVLLHGGQSAAERTEIWRKLASGESKFIIANPEVLLSASVLGKLKDLHIVHIVIDEAHCVSEWGESFRPAYLRIGEIIEAAAPAASGMLPLLTAFTATAGSNVLQKIEQYVFGKDPGVCKIIANPDRSNISYHAQGCILRNRAVRDLLFKKPFPALVFCSSRPGTQVLSHYLLSEFDRKHASENSPAAAIPDIRFYHAKLSREEKTAVEKWFFTTSTGILVSTCAYGMGVDKPDIRTVIHRDCPPSIEAYLQETGRAGRDGKQSSAVLLWGPDDSAALKQSHDAFAHRRLAELLTYAHDTLNCRRSALLKLLNYDGEESKSDTECCDVCSATASPLLREEHSVVGFFKRNKRSYTAQEAAAVLEELLDLSFKEAALLIDELIAQKKLSVLHSFLYKNKITVARVLRSGK